MAAARYFPRTPPFSDLMSYSGRSSSTALVLRFFVGMRFGSCCWTGADDASLARAAIRVGKEEDTPPLRKADRNEASLLGGMIGIGERESQWVSEDRDRVLE